MEDQERKGICDNKCCQFLQILRKQDASNLQKGKYLIKCLLEEISWDLNPFFHFNSNKTREAKFAALATSPEATVISVVAQGEDSIALDVHHLPENITPIQTSLKRSIRQFN